jgi:hypothetical protein
MLLGRMLLIVVAVGMGVISRLLYAAVQPSQNQAPTGTSPVFASVSLYGHNEGGS